ncbi:MAG TPA: YfiR family protein [Sphingomicrobium sp.]|nr:YfiR family protein [Sphingomicrobium sp.]
MRAGGILLAAMALAASALVGTAARAQTTDTAVKAAFLPRFARYVTWPPTARPNGSDPFVLCVIGNDPFGDGLDTAARTQSVDGRRIAVRRLDSVESAGQCHIAYVGGTGSQSIGVMLAALDGRPVLTITDAKHGSPRGIIHFSIVSGRVRFFIDEATAAKRGLAISSRLLALAISVRQR